MSYEGFPKPNYSMIVDRYGDQWTPGYPLLPVNPFPIQPLPGYPLLPVNPFPIQPLPLRAISEDEWQEYQRLKTAAIADDAKQGRPDCEKPGVAEWEQMIERVLIKRGILPPVP